MTLEGRLDAAGTGALWRAAMAAIDAARPARLVVEASRVGYCDGAGIAFLWALRRRAPTELRGLSDDSRKLLDQFPPELPAPEPAAPRVGTVEEVGRATVGILRDLAALVSYVGELTAALVGALLRPSRVRWGDALLAAERAGVNALPIVSLVGFLIGLILAFQAATVLKPFGAELYVADSVGVSLLRELGPLMTAIILAGRSGAAFAAELGTMKVNEEMNALVTMGLVPVRFLVVPRVLAAVAVTPLLAVYFSLLGLLGGAVVFLSLGFPLVTYANQLRAALSLGDFLGGLGKSLVFGILIAAVGCLRGLQTQSGASAVGEAATRAVVSGLVLIIVADGIFGVVFFVLGL